VPFALEIPDVDAVDVDALVGDPPAVDGGEDVLQVVGAADVVLVAGAEGGHAGDEHRQVGKAAAGRHRRHDLGCHRRPLGRALAVDPARHGGHGDQVVDAADGQLHVDRGDERAGELDAVARGGREPRERERQRVAAGTEIDERVLPGVVRQHRTMPLDERAAGGFDDDAGKHATGLVGDGSHQRRLRVRHSGQQEHVEEKQRAGSREHPTETTQTAIGAVAPEVQKDESHRLFRSAGECQSLAIVMEGNQRRNTQERQRALC
jgi:hypothetical protein